MASRAAGVLCLKFLFVSAFIFAGCGNGAGDHDRQPNGSHQAGGAGGGGAGGDGGSGGNGGASLPLTEEECFGLDFDCRIACDLNDAACRNPECLDPPHIDYCGSGVDACRDICEEDKADDYPFSHPWWNCLIWSESDCERYSECIEICWQYLQ